MIKTELKSALSFNKKELNGLAIFCFLLFLIILSPFVYKAYHKQEVLNVRAFKIEIQKFRASAKNQKASYGYKNLKDEIEDKEMQIDYYAFDPNQVSAQAWQKLGMKPYQIKVILNYLAKGGHFYRKEDLKRIYSITDHDYSRLEPYIQIPEKEYAKNTKFESPYKNAERPSKTLVMVDLNTADSILLETLNGIGPAFASRILKYRTRLGGFYSKQQLKEVYGMDSLKYSKLENQIIIDPARLQKININTITFDELKRHPYLSYKQMNAILQYRKQHGNYKSITELKQVVILSPEVLQKIEPYLSFN